MTKRVLIIGGYGNFGSYITETLAQEDLIICIAGLSQLKCENLISVIRNNLHPIEYSVFDITSSLPLNEISPDIVIHTSGPFQEQGYDVAKECIEYGCHYIDLSDGRNFVLDIKTLDQKASDAGVFVISGASSVPCLSSAVIDHYKKEFNLLDRVEYAIATAQQTNRGLATTASILGYTGKPFKTLVKGKMIEVFGWQDLNFHTYPQFGIRPLGNCEIPDLSLFPIRYPELKTIRFYAGTEIKFMHIGLWFLSWLVRFGIISNLRPAAKFFIKIANFFDWMGTSNSAFHMKLSGEDEDNNAKHKTIYILAKEGDGPFIPCAPAIILTKMFADNQYIKPGAFPCIGLIDLTTYMKQLRGLNINLIEE